MRPSSAAAALTFTTLPTALLLLVSLFSIQSLAAQQLVSVLAKLDENSPEYAKCMNNDCAPYLNVTSVCDSLKSDGNFTVDDKVAQQNYLRCVCPEPAYLGGLKTCEKCTGADTYAEKKAECDARDGAPKSDEPTDVNSTPDSTTTETVPPSKETSDSGASVVRGLWAGDRAGYVLTGALIGVAAVLAGVV